MITTRADPVCLREPDMLALGAYLPLLVWVCLVACIRWCVLVRVRVRKGWQEGWYVAGWLLLVVSKSGRQRLLPVHWILRQRVGERHVCTLQDNEGQHTCHPTDAPTCMSRQHC
jgi:hypothetical protein